MDTAAVIAKAHWPPQLVLDIALEACSLDELLEKYDLQQYELELLYENQQFRRELMATRQDLQATGSTFRQKARVLAETHLETMNDLMVGTEAAAQTKVSIWQSFVRYANLEPKKEDTTSGGSTQTFNIQINI